MHFNKPLQEGKFLKRYKRFFADIEWQGKVITAHVPNTGSMKSCQSPGAPCQFSTSDDPKRKLPYTLEMIQSEDSHVWIGVNTANPNKIVKEALEKHFFDWWKGFDVIKPEAKINAETRLDFKLSHSSEKQKSKADFKDHYIEVKNVTLVENQVAQFPDAVSERAQKHVRELMDLHKQGHTVEIVFTIQRSDASSFSPAYEIDPEYARLLKQAHDQGLRITPVVVAVSPEKIEMTRQILPLKWRSSCES